MLHRTDDENNDFFFSEQVLDFIKMVAVDGRSKNRIGPRKVFYIRNEYCILDIWDIWDKLDKWQHEICVLINSKVDGRKFNRIGVTKAEHEKVTLAWICLSLQILYNPAL